MEDQVKAFLPEVENRTVVQQPTVEERQTPSAAPLVLSVAAMAQSVTPWGISPQLRDKELRSFWKGESWLASVVYSVSIRNASYAWEIVGSDPEKEFPRSTARTITRILEDSDRGEGWQKFITKLSQDLLTQDNGAFIEIIRRDNNDPNSPVINIAHLDAAQCQRTGNKRYPVIYTDRNGVERPLPYWRVRTLEELPSPIETAFDIQVCAVSRALLAAEIIESISVYKKEKVGGTFSKALDIVSGVTKNNIDDALAIAQEQQLNASLYRFSLPIILPGVDPTKTLSHIHIDLASLPDNFNEDTTLRWYIATLANCFGVDYTDIAPLMQTGGLGSSSQAEILHLKTQGKGPAYVMQLLERTINALFPSNIEFRFLDADLRSEKEKADARFTRSKDRSLRLEAGELDPKAAREVAVLDGDLPRWLAKQIDERSDEIMQQEQFSNPIEMNPNQVTEGVESSFSRPTTNKTFSVIHKVREMVRNDPQRVVKAWEEKYGHILDA